MYKIVKTDYLEKRLHTVESGNCIQYTSDNFELSDNVLLKTNIEAPDFSDIDYLLFNDYFQLAKYLFKLFPKISPFQATNERFWATVTQTIFHKHLQSKYAISSLRKEEIKKSSAMDGLFSILLTIH